MLYTIGSGPVDILTYTEIGLHWNAKDEKPTVLLCRLASILPQLAIMSQSQWSANLPLSIRLQTTLLASTRHARVTHWKTRFTWRRYCGNKKIDCGLAWSVLLPADPRDSTTFCSPRFEANAWLLNNFSLSALKEKFREQCGKYAERCLGVKG